MTEPQKLVAFLGVLLLVLATNELWGAEIKTVLFS